MWWIYDFRWIFGSQQLCVYLAERRVLTMTDIYVYWSNSQFAQLRRSVRKYLSAPPTSVAREQLFTPCLKKLCKIVFVKISSDFHQF